MSATQELTLEEQEMPPVLFQTTEPTSKVWSSPQAHLPWRCLPVTVRDTTLWVWFQTRGISMLTMLHRSTIQALLGIDDKGCIDDQLMTILDHDIPIVDINTAEEKHPMGLPWHSTHNMLGRNAFSTMSISGGRDCKIEVGWDKDMGPACMPYVKQTFRVEDQDGKLGPAQTKVFLADQGSAQSYASLK